MNRALVFCFAAFTASTYASPNCVPAKSGDSDLVATPEQAVAIAVPVLQNRFGTRDISQTKPFHASLEGNIWHVRGTLPKGAIGGTAEADVCKANGEVINVYHSQ